MASKLELWYPSRPFQIYQRFGESNACTEDKPWLPITKRKVVSKVNGVCPVGYVPLYPLLGMKGHTGLDLYAPRPTILRSPIKGFVEEIQTEPERGLGVGVISDERYDLGEYGEHFVKVRQWHGFALLVTKGQKVEVGDQLMVADSTGLSSGDHNHFELKPVEQGMNGWYNFYQDNGYFGSIDPEPFFNGYFAEGYDFVNTPISWWNKAQEFIHRFFGLLNKDVVESTRTDL